MHTSFHLSMEIGQIFYNEYICRKKQNFPSWKLENGLDSQ